MASYPRRLAQKLHRLENLKSRLSQRWWTLVARLLQEGLTLAFTYLHGRGRDKTGRQAKLPDQWKEIYFLTTLKTKFFVQTTVT
jgi:hypothetical protein